METTTTPSNNISMNQSFQVATDIVARHNQDGTVIVMRLDESSLFYKINGLAAKVWASFGATSQAKTLSDVVTDVTAQYPEFSNHLQQDIPKFIAELVQKKLVIQA